jgi:hypothetical protein
VNYWGYKFKVIPVGSSKSNDDPYADIHNPQAAIWLLEQIA